MMTVYFATLLVVVVLALGLLGLVAMVAAADRGGDSTRLGQLLRTMLAHLNGEAAPPAIFTAFFGPITNRLDARQARKQQQAAADEEPAAIKVHQRPVAVESDQGPQTNQTPVPAAALPAAGAEAASSPEVAAQIDQPAGAEAA